MHPSYTRNAHELSVLGAQHLALIDKLCRSQASRHGDGRGTMIGRRDDAGAFDRQFVTVGTGAQRNGRGYRTGYGFRVHN